MKKMWGETIGLGAHPDAKVLLLEPADRRWAHYALAMHVEAFWAEEQRVLLVTGHIWVDTDEGLRPLPSVHHHELLIREQKKLSEPELTRRVISLVDGWAASDRAHIAGLVPYYRCSFCSDVWEPARAVEDGATVLWKLPSGWLRLADGDRESFACGRHRDDIASNGAAFVRRGESREVRYDITERGQ